jgi:hypothetical protein
MRSISYTDYVKYLFKYYDRRFARHLRFRYVIFNIIMRKQVDTRAGFFIRKDDNDRSIITFDDLRAVFEDNSPESEKLINLITRFFGSLRDIRLF